MSASSAQLSLAVTVALLEEYSHVLSLQQHINKRCCS
jgi:hypothetical protein